MKGAVVGFALPEGGWHGVYVHRDVGPERLGWRLLDLVVRFHGDLDRVRRFLVRAPLGWATPFDFEFEPPHGDARAFFATGRTKPPLLRDTDAFVRSHVSSWYLFHPSTRKLTLLSAEDGFVEPRERIEFDDAGYARFERPADGPLDWRNRCRDYGDEEPGRAAVQVVWRLLSPIHGPRLWLQFFTDLLPTLVPEGLVVPFQLYIADRPNADGSWDPWPPHSEFIGVDDCVIAPRRALRSGRRCEVVMETCYRSITECLSERKVPIVRYPDAVVEWRRGPWRTGLADLFPFHLLDLELDEPTLERAVTEHVRAAFEAR